MKYLYWIFAVAVVLIGIAMSVYLGQETVSIAKIAYNQYSDPAKFAETIHQKMNVEFQDAFVVMLGVTPGRKMDLEVWKAFLEQGSLDSGHFPALVVDPELPGATEAFPNAMKMDLKKEMSRFIEGAKNLQAQGLRIAVIVPSIYASQLLQENPADSLKENSALKTLSISIMGFPRSPEEEAHMEIPCVMGPNDRDGVGAMGCEAQKKARLLYRKKSSPELYEGLVDQVGARDYLILFNGPTSAKSP